MPSPRTYTVYSRLSTGKRRYSMKVESFYHKLSFMQSQSELTLRLSEKYL